MKKMEEMANEIENLNNRIDLLKTDLKMQAENTSPKAKAFPEVQFKNYKNKKRILVYKNLS